jgi:hypothetical protein
MTGVLHGITPWLSTFSNMGDAATGFGQQRYHIEKDSGLGHNGAFCTGGSPIYE